MEKCIIQGAGIDLPIDLIENPEIFSHVLSLNTWKHVLTPENRNHLKLCREKCNGCRTKHSSQKQHNCLTDDEQWRSYYEETRENVDERIWKVFNEATQALKLRNQNDSLNKSLEKLQRQWSSRWKLTTRQNFLPILPTDYPHAQEDNLRALFDEKNFKFGNPLQTFRRKLQAGYYASNIVKYRRQCKTAKLKEYKLKLKKFYRKLVKDVLISRQEIIDQVLSSSHSDMPISLSWHERQMQRSSCLTGNLDNKYKRILKEVKDECEDKGISSDEEPSDLYPQPHVPFNGTINSETCYLSGARDFMTSTPMGTPTSSQQSVTEEDCQRMLQSHKRKRMNREAFPELDTQMISLDDVISRTNVTGKKVSKTVVKKKIKGKDKKEHIRKVKKRRSSVPPPPPPPPVVVDQPPDPVVPVEKDEQVEPVKVPDAVEKVKSLKSLEVGSPCFFCLLRDIFFDLPDTTADLDQVERMVGEWQLSASCAASPWSFKETSWIELIPSALKFLAGSSAASSSPSFLPLVIFKQKVHQWKWIGTYRDKDNDLVPLCEQWFETKDQVVNNVQAPTTCTSPGISLRTDYVVGPSTNDEKSDYQNQERDRYENPHKPFIYRMHCFDSIVAPVKGVFTKESNLNKAREHSLLVSKRPPYVTILTLVRDAAARLPNGEGTRAEVCQLLKDSQYINPDATDGQIHTVVSGALDRLHYEKDPCVKYDNARKVWIYLHKTRSVEEFEKIHEASAAAARAKKQMSQKQKLIKQQQKAKETALLTTHLSPSSSTVEGGDGISTIIAAASVVFPESVPMPKPKKPSKPKRPAASPKKSDKSRGKVKKESLELPGPSVSGIDHPPQLRTIVLPSFPPVHIKQEPPSLDYLEHQEQGLFHSPTSSAFARTSRLNSPYMVMTQPVQDNTLPSYNVKIERGYEKPTVGNGSSSSSSSSESESESDSSSGEDGITGHGSIIPERQDPSLRYGDPRVPFNNVSLFQGSPNGSESENTFGGY